MLCSWNYRRSVYSTGEALTEVGDLLMESGASDVIGLFVAKTVLE